MVDNYFVNLFLKYITFYKEVVVFENIVATSLIKFTVCCILILLVFIYMPNPTNLYNLYVRYLFNPLNLPISQFNHFNFKRS